MDNYTPDQTIEAPVVEQAAAPPPPVDVFVTPNMKPSTQPPPVEKTEQDLELARRRQMSYFQKRREQKKLLFLFHRVRILIKLIVAIICVAGLWHLITSPVWVLQQPTFSLQNQRLIQERHIQAFITPWIGQPLYVLNPDDFAAELKAKYPIIDSVVVRRHYFPPRLDIIVSEKHPWAELYASETSPVPYALMTYDYQLVSLAPYDYHPGAVARHNPPVRIVTNPTQPVLNRKRFLVRLHHLAHQMKTMRGLSLRYIDIRQPGDIVAVFDEVRARVGILDSTAETRVERLFAMIPTIVGMLGQVDGVDLRWNQQVTLHRNAPKTSVSSSTDEPDAVAPAH